LHNKVFELPADSYPETSGEITPNLKVKEPSNVGIKLAIEKGIIIGKTITGKLGKPPNPGTRLGRATSPFNGWCGRTSRVSLNAQEIVSLTQHILKEGAIRVPRCRAR